MWLAYQPNCNRLLTSLLSGVNIMCPVWSDGVDGFDVDTEQISKTLDCQIVCPFTSSQAINVQLKFSALLLA